jgi:3-isopropylmalate/(R)-2-methylmalate dehydratase small subunit
MKPFRKITGTAVPLRRADIDTDAIIPQRWLITTDRDGLGVGLFSNWRYRDDGSDDPDFILNEPRFADARILVAGPNYGCGSSREHAVWAHLDYGIATVIASSFGPIFYDNALKNGLVTVVLDQQIVGDLLAQLEAGDGNVMTVDLERCEVLGTDGAVFRFDIPAARRAAILAGQDEIATTLGFLDEINAFQDNDRRRNPWYWDHEGA